MFNTIKAIHSPLPTLNIKVEFDMNTFFISDLHLGHANCIRFDRRLRDSVECGSKIVLSSEHNGFEWLTYDEAITRLTWDSNKTALYELNCRLLEACQSEDWRGKLC